jgi:histidinol-phosphate/aromatic aminotransferase/cobyric acid decarboxylase-like protein
MTFTNHDSAALTIRLAKPEDRETIYRIRHDIYAEEIGQHPVNPEKRLADQLDQWNQYVVVCRGDRIVGFLSITPPGSPSYSIDKYLDRESYPQLANHDFCEVRLLSVLESERTSLAASLLLYGTFRLLESMSTRRVVAIGRQEVFGMYQSIGFSSLDLSIKSGNVTFLLMELLFSETKEVIQKYDRIIKRLKHEVHWKLDLPIDSSQSCYHGGDSIRGIGSSFENLNQQTQIINADVLDAWFPPCPNAIEQINRHLPWLAKTSPPTNAIELSETIASSQGIASANVVTGAGSSDLIFRALGSWLKKSSRVLLVSPCYGEYEFICKEVIQCQTSKLILRKEDGFQISLEAYQREIEKGYDLIIIVNPNNPTGRFLDQQRMTELLDHTPPETRFWIDECYIDYVDKSQSLETQVSSRSNLTICKSLSKIFGFSGIRVGYLCVNAKEANELRRITPPWNINMLAQVAAISAFADSSYYQERFAETHKYRKQLENQLNSLQLDVVAGTANYLLVYLDPIRDNKEKFLNACRRNDLFIRDLSPTSPSLGKQAIRIAVKDRETNHRMIDIIQSALLETRQPVDHEQVIDSAQVIDNG